MGDRGLPACLAPARAGAGRRGRTRGAGRAGADGPVAPGRAPARQVRPDRRAWPSPAPLFAKASSASRRPSWTSARWRSACSADHRSDLIAERTRIENRLRWHLVELNPALEARIPARCLHHPLWLERVARSLQRLASSDARVRIARQLVNSIRHLTRQADSAETELRSPRSRLSPATAERARLRHPDRRDPDRPHRRRRALQDRRALRPPSRHRADSRLLRQTRPPPAAPRRRPPTQPRPAHHRHHPRPPRPRDPRLPRSQDGRRQDPPRSPALPQTPPRPTLSPTPDRTDHRSRNDAPSTPGSTSPV